MLSDVSNENTGRGRIHLTFFRSTICWCFSKAFYTESFKISPWNITEHIPTVGAYVHSTVTYHRSASGIKGTRHRTSNQSRESTGKLVQKEWAATRVKWDFTGRPCPQMCTANHLPLEGHILFHHKLVVSPSMAYQNNLSCWEPSCLLIYFSLKK